MSQMHLLKRGAMPQMLVIISAATTEDAGFGLSLINGMEPVLAPVAPSCKGEQVALAGCSGFVRF